MQHSRNGYSSNQLRPDAGSSAGQDVEVLVVGAGFSGVGAAIRLRQAGFEGWTVHADGAQPPVKVADLPLDVVAHGHSASLGFTSTLSESGLKFTDIVATSCGMCVF